jgi:hypothetical protein
MAAKKQALSNEEQVEHAVKAAKALLEHKGVVTAAKLGPPKLRSLVIAALLNEGFEKAGKGARVPLASQGERLIEQGHHIPLPSLRKRLNGATAAEATQLAYRLSRDGKAHVVLRGKQLSLVPASEPVVDRAALKELTDHIKLALSWLNKARTNRSGATVLVSDLSEALSQAKQAALEPVASTKPAGGTQTTAGKAAGLQRATAAQSHGSLGDALRGAILALRDEDSALARVPEVSRRLRERASSQAVIEALLVASRQGELELRPEGGIGRLTDEDAALCPMGAAGVRLSWVRLQEG